MPARLIRHVAGALALVGLVLTSAMARADDVLVFAAASLKTALDAVADDWRAQTGKGLTISYAGSSQLARQIEQGAPADVFISASSGWMDYLQSAKLISAESRTDLVGNQLVLVAHGADGAGVELDAKLDLAGLLGDEKLAMALVDAVPAGIYGKQALSSLGLWDALAPKVAQTDNVRAALALVAAGEAPYGIVYASDAVSQDIVSVIGVFPEGSHDPIVYPAARVAASENADAELLLEALKSPSASAHFRAQGFSVLSRQGDG
ncbi:molybdenum ABC transporter, periplasmic molybdate-binding protein [Hoeflea phototrophica DFL-43]|uniref:Molybdate-binding protein ModA n=1 Tax=Hoeflea phototrophica (strain DSM 17068 / NCIMB 14078 / DFL-43) TaxID=411684 RepID=A9DHU1_HOEPD|nr:molybdate ABC transporter substrate-binding protein [Hoeflea phototrophica]EDQ31417.1 molybdenum ABC transporter, periplasmic molybdate-binding protein [Hoeflea phototrophica DFL-43]